MVQRAREEKRGLCVQRNRQGRKGEEKPWFLDFLLGQNAFLIASGTSKRVHLFAPVHTLETFSFLLLGPAGAELAVLTESFCLLKSRPS